MSVPVKDVPEADAPDPQVRVLLSALEEATNEWREMLEDVPPDMVTWQPFPGGHSIGALILHNADVEAHWLHDIGSGEARSPEQLALLLSEETRQDLVSWPVPPMQPLEWYYAQHEAIRVRTRALVKTWDAEEVTQPDRRGRQFTRRWLLAHVALHEAYHGGQAVLLSLMRERVASLP